MRCWCRRRSSSAPIAQHLQCGVGHANATTSAIQPAAMATVNAVSADISPAKARIAPARGRALWAAGVRRGRHGRRTAAARRLRRPRTLGLDGRRSAGYVARTLARPRAVRLAGRELLVLLDRALDLLLGRS